MICHYWYFKEVGFKFEPSVRNKRHDVLMTPNELKNIAILNVGGVDYRCVRRNTATHTNTHLNKFVHKTVRPVFEEDCKFYAQIYLDECLYGLQY